VLTITTISEVKQQWYKIVQYYKYQYASEKYKGSNGHWETISEYNKWILHMKVRWNVNIIITSQSKQTEFNITGSVNCQK